MIKYILLVSIFIGQIACVNKSNHMDYLGQVAPDTIPILFAPDFISVTNRLEQGFSISPDFDEIHFGVIGKHDTLNYILRTQRENGNWNELIKPDYIGNDSVFFPMYSPDGNTLTFAKRHPNSVQTDIWYCLKSKGNWSSAKRFNSDINSIYREGSSSLSSNNNLYFTSNRDTVYGCCGDIYCAEISSDTIYAKAKKLININSIYDEEGVFISPKEDYVVIQSWKVNFKTKHDLYISFRKKDDSWSDLERLDSSINTIDLEQRPFVSWDNKYLFFNRFELDSNFQGIESDIFWVSTKKVFRPFVYNSIPDIILKVNLETVINLPVDYFKDIDDSSLDYQLDFGNNKWLEFDSVNMTLKCKPTQSGEYSIRIIAQDQAGNYMDDVIKMTVLD